MIGRVKALPCSVNVICQHGPLGSLAADSGLSTQTNAVRIRAACQYARGLLSIVLPLSVQFRHPFGDPIENVLNDG